MSGVRPSVLHGAFEVSALASCHASDACVIVNGYTSFEPRTFEELYAVCQALAAKSCETSVRTDALAVIESCTWPGESDCADACGKGFYLRRWGFGEAPGK